MRKVRMVVGVSGGRHDDRPWPPMGGTIEVPDWEAEQLISGGNAVPAGGKIDRGGGDEWTPAGTSVSTRPAEDAEYAEAGPDPVPDPVPDPRPPVEDADAAGTGDSEEAEAAPVTAPSPGEPKQAWIDYAVASGADVHQAGAMTKADLMSRYGGRL